LITRKELFDLVPGLLSRQEAYPLLENRLRGTLARIHTIGGCVKPRKIIDAVSEAYVITTQV
jgi:hypothetical protein